MDGSHEDQRYDELLRGFEDEYSMDSDMDPGDGLSCKVPRQYPPKCSAAKENQEASGAAQAVCRESKNGKGLEEGGNSASSASKSKDASPLLTETTSKDVKTDDNAGAAAPATAATTTSSAAAEGAKTCCLMRPANDTIKTEGPSASAGDDVVGTT